MLIAEILQNTKSIATNIMTQTAMFTEGKIRKSSLKSKETIYGVFFATKGNNANNIKKHSLHADSFLDEVIAQLEEKKTFKHKVCIY